MEACVIKKIVDRSFSYTDFSIFAFHSVTSDRNPIYADGFPTAGAISLYCN